MSVGSARVSAAAETVQHQQHERMAVLEEVYQVIPDAGDRCRRRSSTAKEQ
jgi:hypothetical protein